MTAPHTSFPTLLSPITIGSRNIRNRVVMGSMHTGLEDDLADAPKLAQFYRERAFGGVGIIVTGGFPPTLEGNLTPFGQPFNSPEIVQAHAQITEAAHDGGSLIFLQLLHAGRYGYHPMAVSASASQSPISPFPAREMTAEEIESTIEAYGTAAKLAREAGYDGVQIMGSEGYLINQFLAERTNQRTDDWGGSAENRQRFPVKIVKRVRAAVPEDFIVDYRLSVVDLVEGGQTQEEIFQLADKLEAAGVNMFSSGVGWHESHVPTIVTSVPRAGFAWATAALRDHVNVPVVVSNRINTPAVAESLLDGSWVPVGSDQDAATSPDAANHQQHGEPAGDLVSMARPLLADANLVQRAAAGEEALINHCIACNQACLDHTFENKRATCLVNPRACFETELVLRPAESPKKIGVIGAGVAGLFAAEALAQRGHEVEVFEAASDVGGQFRLAMRIPGKEEFVHALTGVQARLEQLDVAIHTESPRTPGELLDAGYDDVIVASGVEPRIPNIPGLAEAKAGDVSGLQVITYAELASGQKKAGHTVAVIGAGGIGFDIAEYLLDFRDGEPQALSAWQRQWGVTEDPDSRGGLTQPRPESPRRIVFMVQRKLTPMGKGLNKTTGWVHRAAVKMGGAQQIVGAAYSKVDGQGLHITVPEQDITEIQQAIKKAKKAGDKEALDEIHQRAQRERIDKILPVDTIVLCTGQESVRPEGTGVNSSQDGPSAPPSGEPTTSRIHIIGGADVAAELDAKRAIRQGVELAARI